MADNLEFGINSGNLLTAVEPAEFEITVSQTPDRDRSYFTVTLKAEVTVPEGSSVKSIRYRIGDDSYLNYYDEIGVVVDEDRYLNGDTVTFQVIGSDGSCTEKRYQVLYGNQAYAVIDNASRQVVRVDDTFVSRDNITIEEDSSLTIEESGAINPGVLFFSNGTLNNSGSCSTGLLSVAGNSLAKLSGNIITAGIVSVGNGAKLDIDKDQYDSFAALSVFAEDSAGTLIVRKSAGNALRTSAIDALTAKLGSVNVQFQQDLIELNKLTFKAKQQATVGFYDAFGTTKGDTICCKKESVVTLGSKGGVINLEAGKNTLQIDQKATLNVLSDVSNISTIKASSGSSVTLNDVAFSAGSSAALKAEGVLFQTGDLFGAAKKLTVTVGKGCVFSSGDMTFGSLSLTAGSSTILTIGNISCAGTFKLGRYTSAQTGTVDGVQKLTLSNGSKDFDTQLTASGMSGTAKNDTWSIGNYTAVNIAGVIDFGGGKDTLKVGQYSEVVLKAADTGSLKKFTIGKETVAYLSSELKSYYESTTTEAAIEKNKITLIDLGTAAVAANFTNLEDERNDNSFGKARQLQSAGYEGWLNETLDTVDYLTNSTGSALEAVLGSSFLVSYDGINWSEAGEQVALAAGNTLGIRLKDDLTGSCAYCLQLA